MFNRVLSLTINDPKDPCHRDEKGGWYLMKYTEFEFKTNEGSMLKARVCLPDSEF